MCKPNTTPSVKLLSFLFFLFSILLVTPGCDKNDDDNNNNNNGSSTNFTQVNLVASNDQYAGARVDANLVNGWGIALSPTGTVWIAAEGSGTSVVYDADGAEVLPAVSIPTGSSTTGGEPTGIIYNATADFVIPGGGAAKFLQSSTASSEH